MTAETLNHHFPLQQPLRGLSWNSNAFFRANRLEQDQHFLLAGKWLQKGHDFLILQEAHCNRVRVDHFREWLEAYLGERVYIAWSSHPSSPLSTAGIVVILKLNSFPEGSIIKHSHVMKGYAVEVNVNSPQGSLQLFGIYAPAAKDKITASGASTLRGRLWADVQERMIPPGSCWCIMAGDFNMTENAAQALCGGTLSGGSTTEKEKRPLATSRLQPGCTLWIRKYLPIGTWVKDRQRC